MIDQPISRRFHRWPLLLIGTLLFSWTWFSLISSTIAQDSPSAERRQNYRQLEYQRRQSKRQSETYQGNFQSGSEQSVAILREISQTLKSIDARIQKLEKFAESTNWKARHDQAGGRR